MFNIALHEVVIRCLTLQSVVVLINLWLQTSHFIQVATSFFLTHSTYLCGQLSSFDSEGLTWLNDCLNDRFSLSQFRQEMYWVGLWFLFDLGYGSSQIQHNERNNLTSLLEQADVPYGWFLVFLMVCILLQSLQCSYLFEVQTTILHASYEMINLRSYGFGKLK